MTDTAQYIPEGEAYVRLSDIGLNEIRFGSGSPTQVLGRLKDIRISLGTFGPCYRDSPPERLEEFILWAQQILDTIPPEHRSEAKIEITSNADCDGCSEPPDVEIYYYRPETTEDRRARLTEEANYRTQCAAQMEAIERAELAELLAKYGGG